MASCDSVRPPSSTCVSSNSSNFFGCLHRQHIVALDNLSNASSVGANSVIDVAVSSVLSRPVCSSKRSSVQKRPSQRNTRVTVAPVTAQRFGLLLSQPHDILRLVANCLLLPRPSRNKIVNVFNAFDSRRCLKKPMRKTDRSLQNLLVLVVCDAQALRPHCARRPCAHWRT